MRASLVFIGILFGFCAASPFDDLEFCEKVKVCHVVKMRSQWEESKDTAPQPSQGPAAVPTRDIAKHTMATPGLDVPHQHGEVKRETIEIGDEGPGQFETGNREAPGQRWAKRQIGYIIGKHDKKKNGGQ